jgi:peptidoglycan hydrolase-like protein with peptidoglycan-binding domain
MTALSYYQVAQLAYDAGWREPDLSDAVAIAFAESAGNPAAIGDVRLKSSTWGPSVGLWQIRSLNSEKGSGGVRDEKANLNPRTNAIHAHAVFQAARGFFPWTTWTNGAYKRNLAAARAAVSRLLGTRMLSRYLMLTTPMQYGADVASCQRLVDCTPDGWYGPITKGHVITWQRSKGLAPDGIVGPLTAASFGWTWEGPGAR